MLPLPRSHVTQALLADVLELELLFVRESVSREELLDWLGEDLGSDDVHAFDRSLGEVDDDDRTSAIAAAEIRQARAEGSDEDSVLVDDVLLELSDRAAIVGGRYPLSVSGSLVSRKMSTWREAPIYAFLSALNARFLYALKTDFHEGARVFERITVPAIRNYWHGDAQHFGWPRDFPDSGRFPDALRHLSGLIREKLGVDLRQIDPERYKDYGLDAIAWYPLDDRPGKAVLLVQCAVGKGWDTKGIYVEAWGQLIQFAVTPVKGLAFPFVPPTLHDYSEEDWRLLCGIGGIWFDRLRLARLVDPADVEEGIMIRVLKWTEAAAKELVE